MHFHTFGPERIKVTPRGTWKYRVCSCGISRDVFIPVGDPPAEWFVKKEGK
jgi:hypothetical protein